MMETTRRTFLTAAAVASVPVAAVSAPVSETPEQRLEQAFSDLCAAMEEINGEKVMTQRVGTTAFMVVIPPRKQQKAA